MVVSSTRTLDTDTAGLLIQSLLEGAGHEVAERVIVTDDIEAIRGAVTRSESEVVILTGGTGLTSSDVTPEALAALYTRPVDGFGEMFRMLSFHDIGPAAMLSRASAGLIGGRMVFSLPGSRAACQLGMERLILPELGHLMHLMARDESQPTPAPSVAAANGEEAPDEQVEETMSPPSGSLGTLGRPQGGLSMEAAPSVSRPEPEPEGVAASGWQRAVYELQGEVRFDKREDLPMAIEELAPALNLLHTAGETAVLTVPDGPAYSLWGWPDLRRPSSKVLAVGWGEPIAEVLALHRYPSMTGLCIDEERGRMPQRGTSTAEVCERVTGSAPRDASGTLFAVAGDTVWIQRGNGIVSWDGRRERQEGTARQVVSSLMLRWSNR